MLVVLVDDVGVVSRLKSRQVHIAITQVVLRMVLVYALVSLRAKHIQFFFNEEVLVVLLNLPMFLWFQEWQLVYLRGEASALFFQRQSLFDSASAAEVSRGVDLDA